MGRLVVFFVVVAFSAVVARSTFSGEGDSDNNNTINIDSFAANNYGTMLPPLQSLARRLADACSCVVGGVSRQRPDNHIHQHVSSPSSDRWRRSPAAVVYLATNFDTRLEQKRLRLARTSIEVEIVARIHLAPGKRSGLASLRFGSVRFGSFLLGGRIFVRVCFSGRRKGPAPFWPRKGRHARVRGGALVS